ncbi:MAG: ATP-dependent helicase, partial [Candidatus Hermodarchaeota archaeon]
ITCNMSIRDVILWRYNQFDTENVIRKLKDVYKIYKRKKAEDGLLDFDDLLVFWNQLLDEKSVAQLIAKRVKYVLVDEYQDTNYIQDEIIHKIVSQNPNRNVMAVGDDAQSIYSFRGANFKNILDFSNKYKDCKVYKITYNYRSIPEILELANDSIKHNQHQYRKIMKTTRKQGLKPYQVNVGDDWDQARFIANQILALRQEGYKLEEIAVLYRAGYHSLKIEMELQAKNIPYEVRAGVGFFERAHIKDLICHLRIIDNPYDEISWSRIFSMTPGIGSTSGAKIFSVISKTDNPITTLLRKDFFSVTMKGSRIQNIGKKKIISHVKRFSSFSSEDSPAEVISKLLNVLEEILKSKYPNWQDRLDDLKQLRIYAQNYQTIRKFLETLTLNLSDIESKTVKMGLQNVDENPIVLSTLHRAKGLEWRVVFVPMLCEDFFPSSRVIGYDEEFEEERRVFYVAVTRSKDLLYLISPAIVQAYRGHQTVKTSQFVSELNPKVYITSSVQFNSIRKADKRKDIKIEFKSAFDL